MVTQVRMRIGATSIKMAHKIMVMKEATVIRQDLLASRVLEVG